MNKEEKNFKKQCDETLRSIYLKINEEEKIFLSYVVSKFNKICERNFKAIEYIEDKMELTKECPNELLEILKGENNEI